jgi:hypothetical protein
MNCLRPLECCCGLDFHSRHRCLCVRLFSLCCPVCRERPWDGLIPRPRSPNDCVLQDEETEKASKAQQKGCRAINNTRYPRNRQWRPIGLWDVEDPTLFRQSDHRWRWGCQLYAPAPLYSLRNIFWYSFPSRLSQPQGHNEAGNIRWIVEIQLPHRDSKLRPSGF